MDVDIAGLERFRDALPNQLAATKELAQFIIDNPPPAAPTADQQWEMLTGTVGHLVGAYMELAARVGAIIAAAEPR